MSHYHVLTQNKDQKSVQVVFHIPVPASGLNAAGVQWRDVIVAAQGGSGNIISVLGSAIDPAEDTKLKAGEIVEFPEEVRFSSVNIDDLTRQAEIESRWTTLSAELIEEKQITLKWLGFQGNVS